VGVTKRLTGALILLLALLGGCEGDDGRDGAAGATGATGAAGPTGASGSAGVNSLTVQRVLPVGSASCPQGGTRIESGADTNRNGVLDANEVTSRSNVCTPTVDRHFVRVSTFPACRQIEPACNTSTAASAEIAAASEDGMTVVYTDSPGNRIGFVNITNPAAPTALGTLAVGGEPTSVAVAGDFALVVVNTSPNFLAPSGNLVVVNIATRTVIRTIPLTGMPDSVAVSPDRRYAAIAIENERDEAAGNGRPEQLPGGFVVVVNLNGAPAAWTTTNVALNFGGMLFPNDPEPEFVDINSANVAVLTLQENNHIAIIDLPTATVLGNFSAGAIDLVQVDTTDERPNRVVQNQTQPGRLREPDGVAWITDQVFATADEGDLDGGSRTFTVFNRNGSILFSSGAVLEHISARIGNFNDRRSDAKGNEPENVEVATFGSDRYLFVNSERTSMTSVWNVNDPANPVFRQVMPTALSPEGLVAIPSRNLLVVASELDDRSLAFRGGINIYQYRTGEPTYPAISSANRTDGTPIPWGALSGLARDNSVDTLMYAIEDSFFARNRIFKLDLATKPVTLTEEVTLLDTNNVFAQTAAVPVGNVGASDATRAQVFDSADLALLINADKTVNIDPEGIAQASDGGFWIASEGNGSVTANEAGRPILSLNFLFKTSAAGVIERVVRLPDAVNAGQFRFGFEGVAEQAGNVYVAFQRRWAALNDPANTVRIGVFNPVSGAWTFHHYPLDTPTSPNGGWVGLSDLAPLGSGQFLVVERDNQSGPDARIKRLYRIDVTGMADGATLTKTLVRDLLAAGDLTRTGGLVPEKVEGVARTLNQDVWIVNDNDGANDNSGETQMINLGNLIP
jgi:hypothetical protein